MTDRELDERIARALGWGINSYDPDYFNVDHCGTVISRRDFSPATSVDALRKWVLPELERRGLWPMFHNALHRAWIDKTDEYYMSRAVMLSPPSTLAAAALAVLEEDNARL